MQRDQRPPNALADERWKTHGSEASHDDRVRRQDVPKIDQMPGVESVIRGGDQLVPVFVVIDRADAYPIFSV
jgi:hypothetical protein